MITYQESDAKMDKISQDFGSSSEEEYELKTKGGGEREEGEGNNNSTSGSNISRNNLKIEAESRDSELRADAAKAMYELKNLNAVER